LFKSADKWRQRIMSKVAKRALVVASILIAVLVLIRIVIDPVATWAIKRKLKDTPGMKGIIEGAHVSVFPPGLRLNQLKLIEVPGGRWDEPLFYSEVIRLDILWRALLHGDAVLKARLEKPRVVVYRKAKKKDEKSVELAQTLNDSAALKIDRIEIVDGELTFSSGEGKDVPVLWVHEFELVGQNLASRKGLSEGRPATLMGCGRLQKTGNVTVFATIDPWDAGLNVSGRAPVTGLRGPDLNGLLASKADLVVKQGSVDIFAEFDIRKNVISGGVKPVLKNIELGSSDAGLWHRFRAWVVDGTLDFLSDDVPGRDAVAAVVPLKGSVKDPQAQLIPTLIGVVRNAFVVGLRSGFSHLPPQQSNDKESVVKQVKDGLDVQKGQPEAQPTKKGS
jgi:hypothetical protein